jgi:IPT/TIG domain-containing protein
MRRLPAGAAVFLIALAVVGPYLLATAAPSADAEVARLYAAGSWGTAWQSARGGGSPVWMLGPPGLPAPAAFLIKVGIPAERALRLMAGLLYALGALGVYGLARSLELPALWMGVAFALAPGRWAELARDGHAPHAAALAILPFAPLLFARRRTVPVAAGILLLAAFWLPRPARSSLWPEVELLLTLGAGWLVARTGRRCPIVVCVGMFAAGLSWEALFARPDVPPPVSPAAVDWLRQHAPGETTIGEPGPFAAVNPIRRQAEQVILGPGNPLYSVLWLQALGARHALSGDTVKYTSLLDAEYEDSGGYRVYQTPVSQAGPAVVVSRHQWQNLPRLRSLYDRPSLAAYVEWANRPEAAGFRWLGPREAEVRADLGPDDMILVRQNAAAGWTAFTSGQPVTTTSDPIGYLVLDTRRTGPVTVSLRAPWRAGSGATLPENAIPVLNPDGIVDGIRLTPPPFAPGTVVTIHGSGLGDSRTTRVLVAGRLAQVLYAGEAQINARLPVDLPAGPAEVIAQVSGMRSNGLTVEIRR